MSDTGKNKMAKPNIFLAIGNSFFRQGIHNLLKPDYEIVTEARVGGELMQAAIEQRPDVIIADFELPSLNDLEVMQQISKQGVEAKIIILTMHAGMEFTIQALASGVSGFLLKVDASEEITRAIEEALSGRLYITPSIAKDVVTALMQRSNTPSGEEPWTQLTGREREVLRLIAEGYRMTEIGEILHISSRTVERHKYSLMDKLKLHTTAELTKYAIECGRPDVTSLTDEKHGEHE